MEALIGVLIGGVIGYVAAITTLVVEHRRWRKEFKLHYLKAERRYLAEQFLYVLDNLDVLIKGNSQSTKIRARIGLMLPYEVSNEIYAILDKERDEDIKREGVIPYEIQEVMRKPLDEIDKEIKEIMTAKLIQNIRNKLWWHFG